MIALPVPQSRSHIRFLFLQNKNKNKNLGSTFWIVGIKKIKKKRKNWYKYKIRNIFSYLIYYNNIPQRTAFLEN